MNINNDLTEIMKHAHVYNWLPDWDVFEKIYKAFPDSFSILTPFAYAYMEELIRSTTSDYGIILDDSDNPKKHKVCKRLINNAIEENRDNAELVELLEKIKNSYYSNSRLTDSGNNRHSVAHGYMHSTFWTKESFEQLIHDIALLSKYDGF